MTRLAIDTIWPRLIAAADEMATTLFRTAFSHDVVEVHDMSTGLYDDRGNLVGQTWLGATGHVGVMPVVGKELVRKFPPHAIRSVDGLRRFVDQANRGAPSNLAPPHRGRARARRRHEAALATGGTATAFGTVASGADRNALVSRAKTVHPGSSPSST